MTHAEKWLVEAVAGVRYAAGYAVVGPYSFSKAAIDYWLDHIVALTRGADGWNWGWEECDE